MVARNPSRMTYHGTNTYLLEEPGGFLVLDPGPGEDEAHVNDVLKATGGRITRFVVTHGHHDHVGALPALRKRVAAPVCSFFDPLNPEIVCADEYLRDGDEVGPLKAVYTPGHAPDHLCFAWRDGHIFTGDHVMGWSSSVVSPPSGSMADYVNSLELLLARRDRVFLPGHGPQVTDPLPYVRDLRDRRVKREREILGALIEGPASVEDLSRNLYTKVDPVLYAAASRNVMSHLAKLESEGHVQEHDGVWAPTGSTL